MKCKSKRKYFDMLLKRYILVDEILDLTEKHINRYKKYLEIVVDEVPKEKVKKKKKNGDK